MSTIVAIVLLLLVLLLVVGTIVRSVRIIPQARAGIGERFGRYSRPLYAGLNIVVPFIEYLRALMDLREQVVRFPPQPVIPRGNLPARIYTPTYLQIPDPRRAT